MNAKDKMKWETNKGQYQSGESLYLGKIKVAFYEWNISRPKGTTGKDYQGVCLLPSITPKSVEGNAEQVKDLLEKMVLFWFSEALDEC